MVDVSACSIALAQVSASETVCLESSFEKWRQLSVGSFVGCLLEKNPNGFQALPIRLDELEGVRTFIAPDYLPSQDGTVSILFLDTYDPMACQTLNPASGCDDTDGCYLGLGPMVLGQHDSFQNQHGQCIYTCLLYTSPSPRD